MSKHPVRDAFLAGAASVAVFGFADSVSAQQAVADAGRPAGSAACAGYATKSVEADVRCEIREIKRQTDAANAAAAAAQREGTQARIEGAAARREGAEARREGSEAKREGAQIDIQQACGIFLRDGLARKDFAHERMKELAGGEITPANICDVARILGYGRRASIEGLGKN